MHQKSYLWGKYNQNIFKLWGNERKNNLYLWGIGLKKIFLLSLNIYEINLIVSNINRNKNKDL